MLSAIKYTLLAAFLSSALFVHFRSRARFPFLRQLFNHSTLLAPYNALMYLFSAVPATAYLDRSRFPELDVLRDHWQEIRAEGMKLLEAGQVGQAANNDDIGFNSFFKRGWRRFYLKWYQDPLPSARALCPRTVELLESIPNVKAAMFAMLPPGGRLNPHRDPFAGSLRYHLGLVTPNSDACYIVVDGERYHWRDGEDVMFDETYIHYAENNSDVHRLILFADVERPLTLAPMRALNRWMADHFMSASATRNQEGERVGGINRFFSNVYHPVADRIDAAGKRLKAWNRRVYYVVKYGLILGLVYAIFA